MKQNTVRVPHNAGKKPRRSQARIATVWGKSYHHPEPPILPCYPPVKSPFGKDFDLALGQKENACLCIFDRENQAPVQKVPLDDSIMAALTNAAQATGDMSIAGMVALAVREMLAGPGKRPAAFQELQELKDAIDQSDALIMLLVDASNGCDGDKYGDSIQCGIVELHSTAMRRLNGVYDRLLTAAHPAACQKSGVAS